MATVASLGKLPLFAGLTAREIEALDSCLGRRVFGRGVFIFHKDSPGQVLYIIESGLVRLFVISDTGQELSLDVHGPGEVFGELAVLDGRLRASGAVAVEPTVVRTLHRDDLLRLMQAVPGLAMNFIALLTARLRYAIHCVEDLAFLDVNSRVAARLLDLARRRGVQQEGLEIELPLTQTELATWVSASRESVNKVLGTLRSRGIISVDGPKITILDQRRLEREVIH